MGVVAIALTAVAALVVVGFFLLVGSVLTVGTAAVRVNVEVTAFDRATQQPVPGCLLAFEKGSVEDHRGAAACLYNLQRWKEAIVEYKNAVELAPSDPDLHYWYANSLIGRDAKTEEAEFRKVIALEPDEARGYIGLGEALYTLLRWHEAVEAFEQARAICTDCVDKNKEYRGIYEECRQRSGRRS